jgi:hypothetical protein
MTTTFVLFAPFDQSSLTEDNIRHTINSTFDMSTTGAESPNLVSTISIVKGHNGKMAFVEVFTGVSRRFNRWNDTLFNDGIEYITYSGDKYWTCRPPKPEKEKETKSKLPRFE